MPRKKSKKAKARKVSTFDLYRKVVISFIVLTSILILIILYFSFVSVKITVIPKPNQVTTDFTVEVVEGEDGLAEGRVNGVFFSKEVEGEKEFSASGSKSVASDIVGRVTIINNYRRPQPLVATTRLLSPDNILLRIKDRVDVPVNGSVEVNVYADDPSQLIDRTLEPGMHFTIPGLWPQLQDKIYAKAKTTIKLGENKISFVTPEDIDQARQEILAQLESQSLSELGLEDNLIKAVTIEEKQSFATAKAGEEIEKFTVKTKAVVQGLFFDRDTLIQLAEARLRNDLTKDEELFQIDDNSLVYSVAEIDLVNKIARIQVNLEGTSVIRLNSEILNKERIKGLTKEQVKNYFSQQPAIEQISIDFFPFWIRKVPQLADHIELIIQQ